MKKILFSVVLLLISINLMSQKTNINNYKYIIVPKSFDFLKKPNQFQTSSLTKFLFKKNGFIAFLSDEDFPEDLAKNKCLALTADVKDESSMIKTRNKIVLKNCKKEIIFTSKQGKSKLKDFKRAFHEAIKEAFESVKELEYQYKPVKNENSKKETLKKEVANKENKNVLYAQITNNGFQLVNKTPTILFKILKTSVKEVFILENKNGILYKKDNLWIAEYYQNNQLVQEKYQIKF